MNYLLKNNRELGVTIEISAMEPIGKVKEYQIILHITELITSFNQQLSSIHAALKQLLADMELQKAVTVFARCFLSDAANQQEQVSIWISELLKCSISYIQQPPLDGSKIALWLQLQTEVIHGNDGLNFFEHNNYCQYFITADCGQFSRGMDSHQQTLVLLEDYEEQLNIRGCKIEKNCIRTWFFLRDIDLDYQGFVTARKENFIKNGLRNDTHYISSTGISGSVANPNAKVIMDTYAIWGLDEGQIHFLYAKDYLNPTYEYGVTFERGVRIDFGDRRKVYISGTASIDNKGMILHKGDIEGQVHRIWKNVDALLKEAGCSFDDVMQIVVYLRDLTDYHCVNKLYDEKFPGVPRVIVLASICRSGWLVEMECMASKPILNNNYRDF